MILKICGITNQDDAAAAMDGGATAIGFNFYPRSPRYIAPERAAEIAHASRRAACGRVRERERARVWKRSRALAALDVAQLHGDETPADYPATHVPVWKAVRVDGAFDLAQYDDCPVEALLLDGPAGETVWRRRTRVRLAARGAQRPQRIILAGGLDASNVAAAIELAHPWGVDACSRIESAPGKKDHKKMSEFLARGDGGRCAHDAATRPGRPLRTVRRPLRARSPDGAHRGTGNGLSGRARRSRVSGGAGEPAAHLRRPSDAAVLRQAAQRATGRRAHLAEARRPAAHRRAQDQQLPGPGAAGAAHGQAPHHRRNRRRTARRGHRHGVRAAGLRVRGLHGRGGHAPPAAERLPHAHAGRQSGGRDQRQPHPEGRHQRGHARLGDQRRRHALPARIGAGLASLSHDGARFSQGDRRRGARARFWKPKAACRIRSSPAWAAARTPSVSSMRFCR